MKKQKLFITMLLVVSLLVVSAAFVTLSITASEQSPTNNGGEWAEVCCGSTCGIDFCKGTGTYKCCK